MLHDYFKLYEVLVSDYPQSSECPDLQPVLLSLSILKVKCGNIMRMCKMVVMLDARFVRRKRTGRFI